MIYRALPTFGLFFSILASAPVLGSPVLGQRDDLKSFFSLHLCQKRNLSVSSFWENQIFDAQIEGKFFASNEIAKLTPPKFSALVTDRAKQNKHHGWAGDRCPDGNGWAVSTPAPKSFIIKTPDKVLVAAAEIKPYCADLQVDYVNAAKGRAVQLELTQGTTRDRFEVATKDLSRGMVTLTCLAGKTRRRNSGI